MFDRILDKISGRTKEDPWKFGENLEDPWVNIIKMGILSLDKIFNFFITL